LELNRYAENTRNIAKLQVEEDHVKVFIHHFFLAELLPDDFFPDPIPDRLKLETLIKVFAVQISQIPVIVGNNCRPSLN